MRVPSTRANSSSRRCSAKNRFSTADFPHVVPLADLTGSLGGHQDVHCDAIEVSYVDISVRPGA